MVFLIKFYSIKYGNRILFFLIVTKINCEESDLYQITIYPEGGENGIARPEFNVEGSHRREESWTHQYQFDNPNEPDQNAGLE